MKTFVTGGTSSIGRVLVKELSKQGQALRLLVRKSSRLDGLELPGVEFVEGDVNDAASLRAGMEGCGRVTHLAAIVGHNLPEETWWKVNRDGTRLVLEAARLAGVESMVQVSSIGVLGATTPGELADESRPIDPATHISLYQKTKFAADEVGREFAARGSPVKIVYPTFGYGCSRAGSHPSMHEQTLLRMASGKPVAVLGNGKNRLCLAYYKDTVAGIQLAHERGTPGQGYILGGENLTFPEIWAAIADLLGKPAPTRRVPLPILKGVATVIRLLTGKYPFPPEFFEMIACDWNYSSAKAERELGWKFHAFQDGIAETWAEYQAQGWKPAR
jgi:nucleoside-diphosphate-sugar epimerase